MQEHPDGYAVMRYHAGELLVPDLKPVVQHLGQLLLRHGWYKILTDTRSITIFPEETKEWVRADWLTPVLPRPPYLLSALVLPTSVFSRLAVSQLQAEVGPCNTYRNFPDEATAHAFLCSQPATSPARQP